MYFILEHLKLIKGNLDLHVLANDFKKFKNKILL